MASRFTRVTVLAEDRTVDVSLPVDRPIVEILPQLRDLMSLAPRTDTTWALSTVAAGPIDPRRSLGEAGVMDAEVLYLTAPGDSPAPPVVDDVVDTVASTLDNDGSEWTGTARAYGCCALAGVAVVAFTAVAPWMSLRLIGVVLLLVDVALAAAITAWLLRGRGGDFLVFAAVPTWILAGIEAGQLITGTAAGMLAAGLAGAGLGCAALAVASRRWQLPAIAGAAALFFGLLGTVLLASGLRAAQVAAIGAVLVVVAVALAPQFALSRSRLVRLLRAEEDGERTEGPQVTAAVRRGQAALTGAVVGLGVVGSVLVAGLFATGSGLEVALGSALAAGLALRSRSFTRTGQVWPMLLPAVIAATVSATALPLELNALPVTAAGVAFGGAVLLVAVLVAAGRPLLGEVGAARWRQILDVLEVIALISLVPLAIAVMGAFDSVIG